MAVRTGVGSLVSLIQLSDFVHCEQFKYMDIESHSFQQLGEQPTILPQIQPALKASTLRALARQVDLGRALVFFVVYVCAAAARRKEG